MFTNNRFSTLDAIVNLDHAANILPGYEMYSFAIFDNDLTKDKYIITVGSPSMLVTFNQSGTSERLFFDRVSDLLLDAGYNAPNVILKCKKQTYLWNNAPVNGGVCTRYFTISTPSDLVDYESSRIGIMQSFALDENLDSWPSMLMRLVSGTANDIVLSFGNNGIRISWDSATQSIRVLSGSGSLQYSLFTEFTQYVNFNQTRVTMVSVETPDVISIHRVPKEILDVDTIKGMPNLQSYFPFNNSESLWSQILDNFFAKQPHALVGIAKYQGIFIPMYAKTIAYNGAGEILVPKTWCGQKSKYECLKIKYDNRDTGVFDVEYVSGNGGCAVYGKQGMGAGTLLIEFAKDLAKYVLKAVTLQLEDLSTVQCKDDQSRSIPLSLITYIQKGKTWYESKDIKPVNQYAYDTAKQILETPMSKLQQSAKMIGLGDVDLEVDETLQDVIYITKSLKWETSQGLEELHKKLKRVIFNMIYFMPIDYNEEFKTIADLWDEDGTRPASDLWFGYKAGDENIDDDDSNAESESERDPPSYANEVSATIRSDALELTDFIVDNIVKILAYQSSIPNPENIQTFDEFIAIVPENNQALFASLKELVGYNLPLFFFILLCAKNLETNEMSEVYKITNILRELHKLAESFKTVYAVPLYHIKEAPESQTMKEFLLTKYGESCASVYLPMVYFLKDSFGYTHLRFFFHLIESRWSIPYDEPKHMELKRKRDGEETEQTTKRGKFDLPFFMDE